MADKKGLAAMIVKDIAAPEKEAEMKEPEAEMSDSEFAAQELIDAVKSGDVKAVAGAFKSLMACSGEEESEEEISEPMSDQDD
jgi:hypothetical protein